MTEVAGHLLMDVGVHLSLFQALIIGVSVAARSVYLLTSVAHHMVAGELRTRLNLRLPTDQKSVLDLPVAANGCGFGRALQKPGLESCGRQARVVTLGG